MSQDNNDGNKQKKFSRRRKHSTLSPLRPSPQSNQQGFSRSQAEYSPNSPSRRPTKARCISKQGKKVKQVIKKGKKIQDFMFSDYAYAGGDEDGSIGDIGNIGGAGGDNDNTNVNSGRGWSTQDEARSMRLCRDIQQEEKIDGEATTEEEDGDDAMGLEDIDFGMGFSGMRGIFNNNNNNSNSNNNSNTNRNRNRNLELYGDRDTSDEDGGQVQSRGRRRDRALVNNPYSNSNSNLNTNATHSRSKSKSKTKSQSKSRSRLARSKSKSGISGVSNAPKPKSRSRSRSRRSKSRGRRSAVVTGAQADQAVLDELEDQQPPIDIRQVLPGNFIDTSGVGREELLPMSDEDSGDGGSGSNVVPLQLIPRNTFERAVPVGYTEESKDTFDWDTAEAVGYGRDERKMDELRRHLVESRGWTGSCCSTIWFSQFRWLRVKTDFMNPRFLCIICFRYLGKNGLLALVTSMISVVSVFCVVFVVCVLFSKTFFDIHN